MKLWFLAINDICKESLLNRNGNGIFGNINLFPKLRFIND